MITLVRAAIVALCLLAQPAGAGTSRVSQNDAAAGMREALAKGVDQAVRQLGRKDGFLGDQLVRIAVPKKMQKLAKTARKLGADKYVDAFEVSMNRAAEKAVPLAAGIFADAVREMSVDDALAIVGGSGDAATQYFRKVSDDRLEAAFLPVVSQAMDETDVAKAYKKLGKKAGGLGGLLGGSDTDTDLDRYVTRKAMDGLYYYVAEKEKAIRKNPLAQGSDLLRRVFGKR